MNTWRTIMKNKHHGLIPRKPSTHFVKVFQSHCFDDNLRPAGHPNKGKSWGHDS